MSERWDHKITVERHDSITASGYPMRHYTPVCSCGWTCKAAPRQKWRAVEMGDGHLIAQAHPLPDECPGCGRGREAWSCRCGGAC